MECFVLFCIIKGELIENWGTYLGEAQACLSLRRTFAPNVWPTLLLGWVC